MCNLLMIGKQDSFQGIKGISLYLGPHKTRSGSPHKPRNCGIWYSCLESLYTVCKYLNRYPSSSPVWNTWYRWRSHCIRYNLPEGISCRPDRPGRIRPNIWDRSIRLYIKGMSPKLCSMPHNLFLICNIPPCTNHTRRPSYNWYRNSKLRNISCKSLNHCTPQIRSWTTNKMPRKLWFPQKHPPRSYASHRC